MRRNGALATCAVLIGMACRHTDDGGATGIPPARSADGGATLQHDDTKTGEPIGPLTRTHGRPGETAMLDIGGSPGAGGLPGSGGADAPIQAGPSVRATTTR